LGKETILQCEISASPQALVSWKKGEAVFPTNDYHRITSEIYDKDIYTTVLLLRIQNLTWSDFGEYICEASNVLGRDQESMQLFRKCNQVLLNSMTFFSFLFNNFQFQHSHCLQTLSIQALSSNFINIAIVFKLHQHNHYLQISLT
jgi:hypothetical protein